MGSGPAGVRASEAIRRRDRAARIVVVSADPYAFYNRILLSKDPSRSSAPRPWRRRGRPPGSRPRAWRGALATVVYWRPIVLEIRYLTDHRCRRF
ncbi:MAG: hypothetical protein ACREK7_09470 [Gemmatimonadota bacterium]